MADKIQKHVPMPLDTPAFKCALCGAVALSANSICQVQGKVKKGDWCGSPSIKMPLMCQNLKNTKRYVCKKCGRVAINPALLCEPEAVPLPKS
jgi:predicted RNA-binding Zn-ribbon protein involved in translation (DUF1610 family)